MNQRNIYNFSCRKLLTLNVQIVIKEHDASEKWIFKNMVTYFNISYLKISTKMTIEDSITLNDAKILNKADINDSVSKLHLLRLVNKTFYRGHPLSTCAKFSEKLTFLTPRYVHVCVLIRGLKMLVFRKILRTYLMDGP